jgi:hypothetical protein
MYRVDARQMPGEQVPRPIEIRVPISFFLEGQENGVEPKVNGIRMTEALHEMIENHLVQNEEELDDNRIIAVEVGTVELK